MKKNLLSVVVCAVLLISSSSAFAGLRQGAKELGLNITGGYGESEGLKSGDVGAQVSFGYFLTDKIQIGGSLMDIYSGSKADGGAGVDTNFLNLALQAKFYAPWERASAPFHSYIGPHLGVTTMYTEGADGEGSTMSGFAVGGMIGFDVFFNEDVALNGEARYTHSELSSDDFDSKRDDIRGLLGFKVFFGGK